MRKIIAGLVLVATLIAGIFPAIAQAPGPVPTLPDIERRSSYTITAQTGPFDVQFALFGTGTDYGSWVEVWLNGVQLTPVTDWTLALTSGTLATAARPMTNARVTLTTPRTGILQIVGAERPRRLSQFAENRGVAARDLNLVITGLVAQNREAWNRVNDVTGRVVMVPPGDTLTLLPPVATRKNNFLSFDAAGNPTVSPGMVPAGTAIGINSTPVTGGTNRYELYNNNGVLGNRIPAAIQARDYGAICDGATADDTALQNLINDAISLKVAARFSGPCRLATGLTITNGIDFGGQAWQSTLAPDAGVTAITINTPNAVSLHDFYILYPAANAGTAGIRVTATTENFTSRFWNLTIDGADTGIDFVRASLWTLSNSLITNFRSNGLSIDNTRNSDSGDSTIYGNTFSPGLVTSNACVLYKASGGLRFQNNKCLGGGDLAFGFQMVLVSGASTGPLFIDNNSLEGFSPTSSSAIQLKRVDGTSFFAKVVITNNHIGQPLRCLDVPTDASGAWLNNVALSNNICTSPNNALAVSFAVDSTVQFIATGNTATSANAATKMFSIGSAVTGCQIGINVAFNGAFTADSISPGACTLNLRGLESGASGGIPYYSGAGALSASPLLPANQIMVGGGAGSPPTTFACATTTTVVHGGTPPTCSTIATGDIANNAVTLAKLATQAANTVLANATSGAAVPTAFALPSCSTSASALNWTTNTGFGCNTAINAAQLNGATFASPGTIGGTTPGLINATEIITGATTVGALPTCNAGHKAARNFVTDANATFTAGIGAVVAAGGANNVPVTCDGTNWRIGANDNGPMLARKFA